MAKNANSNEFFKDGILHNIEQDHQLLQPKSNLNRNPLWICCPKSVGLLNIIASQVSLIDYMVTSVAKWYKYKNAMKVLVISHTNTYLLSVGVCERWDDK